MKGSLRKIALTFSVLVLLAVNAAAQCGGKTVYVQLPNAGWSKTAINILWEGGIRSTTATPQGDFSVFTFPSGWPNDNATKTFAFSAKNDNIDNGNQWIASGNRYNIEGARPADAAQIACSAFGNGNILYISPSPTNPSQTLVSTQPPNAYNFYFLPPSDPEWTLGVPYIVYLNSSNRLEKIKLTIDGAKCGWYKKTFFNEPVPEGFAWIWLNEGGSDKVGLLGLDEDPLDWDPLTDMPTPFKLKEQFDNKADNMKNLFFIPAEGASGWYSSDLGRDGVCSYNFAAIIYDTDWSVNSSFQCGRYEAAYNGNQTSECYSLSPNSSGTTPSGYGINKNIPQNTLRDGKMQWNPSSIQKDGWTEQNFTDAFKPTTGKNVVRCYDMPFKRNSSGLWEFNSNKLCKNNTMDLDGDCGGGSTGTPGYMGGFFPPMLDPNDPSFDNSGYGNGGCPTCKNVRFAESWAPLKKTGTGYVSQFCYDRGKRGTSADDIDACGTDFGQNDFRDGDNPAIWDWDGRPNFGGTSSNTASKNQLFCFESTPATFVYEPGQEFFFSGDDDIWVFINNRLAIDLGGTHLATPGYVNLKAKATELGLQPDSAYPINIFFCDRRTTMSNVRITTNMYFAQKNSLKVTDNSQIGGNGAQVCVESTGSDGTCNAVTSGTGGTGGEKCGRLMGDIVDYYLQNRKGEQVPLNTSNDECKLNGGNLVCYGGITLTNWPTVDRVIVRAPNTYGLVGTQKIYAKIKDREADKFPNATPVLITTFSVQTTVKTVWGEIFNEENGRLIYNLGNKEKSVVSGKLVPIGFAAGEWRCEDPASNNAGCGYDVFMAPAAEGGSLGQVVRNIVVLADPDAKYSGLEFYRDSLGTQKVQSSETFTIPSDGPFAGLLVLWVAGDYSALEDETYTINTDLKVKVYLPRLAFIDPQTNARLAQTKGSDPSLSNNVRDMGVMVGMQLDRAIAAYDVSGGSPGVLCTTCDFKLAINAWATDNNGGRLDNNTAKFGVDANLIQSTPASGNISLENGIAQFTINGRKSVVADTFAFFRVRGPSEKPETFAQWDSLLFEMPEFPIPTSAKIFDRNGDGIGDSLHIAYDRFFHRDSLPSKLLVTWDPDTTFEFGLGEKVGNIYSGKNISSAENRTYWNKDHGSFKLKLEGGAGAAGYSDTAIVIYDIDFSEDIKTFVGPGNIEVISWATYMDSKKGAEMNIGVPANIEDKIPAIVVKAEYVGGEKCKSTVASPCEDLVTIRLSEPVKANPDISRDANNEARRAPFAYKLWKSRNIDEWRYFHGEKNLPSPNRMSWKNSGIILDEHESDSLVYITYSSYKDAADTTYTPAAGDSVRFVWEELGYYALMDLAGNKPNPREIGREFEGSNRFEIDKISIAELDPEKDILKEALKELEKNDELGFFKSIDTDTLFNDKRPITFLPGLEGWTAKEIKETYPGSLGQLFKPDVYSRVSSEIESKDGVEPVLSENIVFYAKVFYHTNLGGFVVESKPIQIKCNDPVFQINGAGDCRDKGAKSVYLAWNLRDAKNRWVGAGAYVEVYDFWWEVSYKENGVNRKATMDKAMQKIEMMGVKRVKKGR